MLFAMQQLFSVICSEYQMTSLFLNKQHEEILSTWWASSLTSHKTGRKEGKSFVYYFHVTLKCSSQMEGD